MKCPAARASGNLPDEMTWLTGFRVVAVPKGTPSPTPDRAAKRSLPSAPTTPPNHRTTSTEPPPPNAPVARPIAGPGLFFGPKLYVKIAGSPGAERSFGPLWSHHNHDPALSTTPAGDMIAIWFTTWEVSPSHTCAQTCANCTHVPLIADMPLSGTTSFEPPPCADTHTHRCVGMRPRSRHRNRTVGRWRPCGGVDGG